MSRTSHALAILMLGLTIAASTAASAVVRSAVTTSLGVPDPAGLLNIEPLRDLPGRGAVVFNAQYPGQTLGISSSQFLDNVAKPVVAGNTNSHNGGAILVHDYCPDTRIPAVVAIDTSVFSGNRVQPVELEGRGGAIAVYDNSTLGDDAAKEKDRQTRTATFTRALQNMKTIAEGGTLPPPPPRAGGPGK